MPELSSAMPLDEKRAALTAGGQEPVAWPRIMYVCEYCHEHNPEMCGHDRTDLHTTPDGRWLCDGCLDDEGVPITECLSPPLLYLAPPTAQLEALRKERDAANARAETAEARVAELEKALEPFARNVELIHPGAQDHDRLCDYGSQFNGTPTVGQARAARRVREGEKVDG